MKKEIIEKINKESERLTAEDAAKYGLTEEEIKASAERMKDPQYRKKIHDFAKDSLK